MTNAQRYIVSLLAGMIFGLVLACIGRGCKPSSPAKPIVLTDTIRVHDTLRIKEHTKPREVVRIDTIWLKGDTITEYVEIPITQSEYRDTFATDSTRAEVAVLFSGYNARIDSIGINYRFEVEPRVIRKKKGFGWCVMPSLQVGYGVALGSQVVAAPYIGVGVAIGWGYHF